MIKSKRRKSCIWEGNDGTISVIQTDWKGNMGRHRCKWENMAEMALKAAGWEHVDWIDLAQHSA
jgi:hypothetical protein